MFLKDLQNTCLQAFTSVCWSKSNSQWYPKQISCISWDIVQGSKNHWRVRFCWQNEEEAGREATSKIHICGGYSPQEPVVYLGGDQISQISQLWWLCNQGYVESATWGFGSGSNCKPQHNQHDVHSVRQDISITNNQMKNTIAGYLWVHNTKGNLNQEIGAHRIVFITQSNIEWTRDSQGDRLHLPRYQETSQNSQFFILPQHNGSGPHFHTLYRTNPSSTEWKHYWLGWRISSRAPR